MKEGRGVYLRRMGQLNEDGYTEIAVTANYFTDDAKKTCELQGSHKLFITSTGDAEKN